METINEVKEYLQSTDLLSGAIDNAEMLLNHAASHGLEISKETVAAIIAAKNIELEKKWNADTEINFWLAYKSLSKEVHPVTVDSLMSTHNRLIREPNIFQRFVKKRTKESYSRTSARIYLLAALASMLLMLATQMFSLKGTTLLNTIQRDNENIQLINKDIDKLKLLLGADKTNKAAKLEKERLYAQKAEYDQEIRSSIELLEPWVYVLRKFTLLGNKKTIEKAKDDLEGKKKIALPFAPPGTSTAENGISHQVNIIQEAQNFTQIIQLYILPLLYGLIGGFIFVLRGLATDFKNLVYSRYSNIKYSLRIHLGALAGLIVGLLWGDIESQRITFIDSLSTAALAFIAGYGVEYVFNGLDKFANSISKNKED